MKDPSIVIVIANSKDPSKILQISFNSRFTIMVRIYGLDIEGLFEGSVKDFSIVILITNLKDI